MGRARSVPLIVVLMAGGAAIMLYGFVTREVSLAGATLRCGTPGRTIVLTDFTDVRETSRTNRGPRNEFRGERAELAGQFHGIVLRGQPLELVGRAFEARAGGGGQRLRDARAEAGIGIDAGADSGTAQRQPAHPLERVLDARLCRCQLRRPRREFLAEGQRHGIHQMGPAGLHHLAQRPAPRIDGLAQVPDGRHQIFDRGKLGRHPDRRGDDVVGALAEVDVVVRVHLRFPCARSEGGDDLVGVHVGRRAGAGLVDIDREMRVVLTARDLVRGGLHGLGDTLGQQAQACIDFGRRRFHQAQGADEATRHRPSGDREVLHGPLCLRAPQGLRGHLQFAHAVVLDAGAARRLLAGHHRLLEGFHGLRAGEGRWLAERQDTPGRWGAFPG